MGGGVRQDGILLVNDTGGGGIPVEITAPIGPNVAADSVSVTLATDEGSIPVEFDPITINATGTIDSIGDTVPATDTGIFRGCSSATVYVTGVFSTLICEYEFSNNGTVWRVAFSRKYLVGATGVFDRNTAFLTSNNDIIEVLIPPGCTFRVRCTGLASGSADFTIHAVPGQYAATQLLDNNGSTIKTIANAPANSDIGLVVRQVGIPLSAVLADNTSNPTLTAIQVYPMVFDGATWDRLRGNSTDGLQVDLGANNDVRITDGTDVAQVHSSADTININDKGLLTQSVIQLKNNDGTVSPWEGNNNYATFASGLFPWIKAMRSFHEMAEATLDGLAQSQSMDVRERSLEAVVFYIRNSNLIGTLKFLTTPGDASNPAQVYNVRTAAWELGEIVDPTLDTLYLIPAAGFRTIQLVVTAYTSGSLLAQVAGGPGVNAIYANVSGSIVGIDGVITGDSFAGTETLFPMGGVSASATWVPGVILTSVPASNTSGLVVRQVGLPAAAALADNTANPTLTQISVFPHVFDGTNWDLLRGTSADGLLVNPNKASSSAQTTVNDNAASVTILAANSARRGATIINDSTATLYLRLSSSSATTTNYTVQIVTNAYYEVPFQYTGEITGIWASDPNTGAARVTELTA